MVKYSEGFKLSIVKEYKEGHLGYHLPARSDKSQLRRWEILYEKLVQLPITYRNNETYPVHFKLDVLDVMKRTGATMVETALSYRVMNQSNG